MPCKESNSSVFIDDDFNLFGDCVEGTITHPSIDPVESYGELIHSLNQRYKNEWDRAERLQSELNDIRRSKAWRVFSWLRKLKRRLTSSELQKNSLSPFLTKRLEPARGKPKGRVCILIPFRDQLPLLRGLLQSLRKTTYEHYDVLLIDNGSTCVETRHFLRRLRADRRIRVASFPEPFHFARLCNYGANQVGGEYLLFLNNDMAILSADWLEQLLALAQQPDIGVAGATLLYPNGTIQHAGVFPVDDNGTWTHVYRGCPSDYPGDQGELRHAREVPAVTGACMLIRRDLFWKLGGFSEQYPLTGNDVELCRRVRSSGLAVGITPHARLLHFESLSRGYSVD